MRAARFSVPLTCLFIGVDSFKRINDTYGHQTGDRAMYRVKHNGCHRIEPLLEAAADYAVP